MHGIFDTSLFISASFVPPENAFSRTMASPSAVT
jgi:hypothetical protein